MVSIFVREQKRYSKDNLKNMFNCSDLELVQIIKKLKEYRIIKIVKYSKEELNMSELMDNNVEIFDEDKLLSKYLYVFTFVGIIIVHKMVLKCYPKYIYTKDKPLQELKQIIKVLQKYNDKEQIVHLYNDEGKNNSFNRLATILSLFDDFFENGIYINSRQIVETNGRGEINWNTTINNTHPILINNIPYYVELQTKKVISDNSDFITNLHKSLLTSCSKELEKADLLELLDITGVELSNDTPNDLGDSNYLLYRIEQELKVQFNTRKQNVLKTMYALITDKVSIDDVEAFSLYGTSSFNLVWEKVCSEVLDNQLHSKLCDLVLPGKLIIPKNSSCKSMDELIDIIEKPKWRGYSGRRIFEKEATDTLKPDIVSIINYEKNYIFAIFDAKYYTIKLEEDESLKGQPGISDITKQYLYQLFFRDFVVENNFTKVKNYFLMPITGDKIIEKGNVRLDVLSNLNLQNIEILLLPAQKMYSYYLNYNKLRYSDLYMYL